jgi:endogenous inhibitor of DNA gyrase (YacG/DUF329 family)
MNILKCKRCGGDIQPGPKDTNRTFCSVDCRDTWWNEFRSHGVTRDECEQKKRMSWTKNTSVPHLTETQAVWLAAMIDGEGHISIYRERRRGNTSGFRFKLVVVVTNTNKNIVDRVVEITQGFAAKKDKRPKNHKPCYRAQVHGRNNEVILRAIRPYLVAKGAQADRALEFCLVMQSAPMRASLVHDIFERLRLEVNQLNRRGVEA